MKLWRELTKGYWSLEGANLEVSPVQKTYILSLGWEPCEICLKLFLADAYMTVNRGKELDHIEPLNPENALDSNGYGDPFDHHNLQLLCYRHHSRKSGREVWK